MASSSENEEAHAALSNSARIHIAHLNSAYLSEDRHIEADIVLVWPYSSGTKELSLLLAERDVSLRKAMGQVKVTFHGAVAKELARSKPGIGNTVRLSLGDVEMIEEQNEVHTPGKKAAFTLHCFRAVLLKLSSTEGQSQLVGFVASNTPPTSSSQHLSPATERIPHVSKTRAVSGSASMLRTSQRLSSNSFPGSMVDPFTQEDGYVEGRGRKRTKFARYSGAWRFIDSDEGNNNVDSPREEGHVRTSSDSTDGVLEGKDVVGSTQGALPLETAPEFGFVDAVEVEELQSLKHRSIEHGPASSINDDDDNNNNVKIKGFERSPSPEGRSGIKSNLSASPSPSDREIPVERMSGSPDEATGMATPGLEAVVPSGLPIISPFASRDQQLPPLLGQPSVSDVSTSQVERPDVFFQLSEPQPQYAVPAKQPEPVAQPLELEVQQSYQDNDAQLAIPPINVLAQGIDLEFLQQQIDIENSEDVLTGSAEEAVEDKDMYGPLDSTRSGSEFGSEEQHESLHQNVASLSNMNNPIVLDDDDDDEAQEEDETEENEDNGDDGESRMGLSKSPRSDLINFEADGTMQVVEKYREADEEDITDQPTSASASSPVPIRPDGEWVVDDEPEIEQASEHTYIDLDVLEDTVLSEDNIAADRTALVTSDVVAPATPLSLQFHDGIVQDTLPEAMPLLPVDAVDIELQPVAVQYPEAVDRAYLRPDIIVGEGIPDFVSFSDDPQTHEAIAAELTAQQATLAEQPSEGDQLKAQPDDMQELPRTPFDNHRPPPEKADSSEATLPPLPQTDGASARRASRRLLDRPRMSDDVYSDYFTPRKSVVKSKNLAQLENTRLPEDQEEPKPSSPVTHVPPHSSEGLQMSLEGPTSGMKLTNPADDVPWAASRGTVTDTGYYVYLEYLGDYYDQLVDVLAVCTANGTSADRAKSGPKDFSTTIHLVDPSAPVDSSSNITAQIFRPRKHAIPSVARGNVILLRNFKVQTQSHKPFLLSTDESAWAVFSSATQDATMAGPPVEFDHMERAYVSRLLEWWTSHGAHKYPDLPAQTQEVNDRSIIKKPVPQLLDLRRSPRRAHPNRTADGTEAAAAHDQSPSFNPQSPDLSPGGKSALTLGSPSVTGRSSPTSTTMMRGMGAPSVSVFETGETGKTGESNTISPSPTASTSHVPRNHNRHVHIRLTPSMDRAEGEPAAARRSFAEGDNAVVSEDETSASSKRRHRHERRSTSLVHELRDGTRWVDIDDFEVVSVSEGETEETEETQEEDGDKGGEDNAEQTSLTAAPPDPAARDISPLTAVADTPSKRLRGRPRKGVPRHRDEESATTDSSAEKPRSRPHQEMPQHPGHEQQQQQEQQPGDNAATDTRPRSSHSQGDTTVAGTGRVTRSKAAKDSVHNVHELRDGATYED